MDNKCSYLYSIRDPKLSCISPVWTPGFPWLQTIKSSFHPLHSLQPASCRPLEGAINAIFLLNPYGSQGFQGYSLVLLGPHILLLLQSQILALFPFWDCRFKSLKPKTYRGSQQKSPDQVGTGLIGYGERQQCCCNIPTYERSLCELPFNRDGLFPKTLQWAGSQWWLSFYLEIAPHNKVHCRFPAS